MTDSDGTRHFVTTKVNDETGERSRSWVTTGLVPLAVHEFEARQGWRMELVEEYDRLPSCIGQRIAEALLPGLRRKHPDSVVELVPPKDKPEEPRLIATYEP